MKIPDVDLGPSTHTDTCTYTCVHMRTEMRHTKRKEGKEKRSFCAVTQGCRRRTSVSQMTIHCANFQVPLMPLRFCFLGNCGPPGAFL